MKKEEKLLKRIKLLRLRKVLTAEEYKKLKSLLTSEKREKAKASTTKVKTSTKRPMIVGASEIIIPTQDFLGMIKDEKGIKIILGKKISLTSELKEVKEEKIEEKEERPKEEKKEEEKLKSEREKLKEDLNLIDLKKEIKIEPEKEEKEEEKPKKKGLLERLRKTFRKKEDIDKKLMRLTLQNLEKIKKFTDDKTKVIATATVLNDFLEIKFRIPRELTHGELVEELAKMNIRNEELKNSLMDFYKRLEIEEYTGRIDEDPEEVLRLAEQTVKELSKQKVK